MVFPSYGIELVFGFTLPPGTAAKTVLHLEKSPHANPSVANLNDLTAAAADWWTNDHGAIAKARSNFSTGVTLVNVTATARGLVPQLQSVQAVGTAGQIGGNPLPPESSVVTTWYTGTPGRSYRGRNFWPQLAYGQLGANGELTAAVVTGLQLMYAELRTLLEATPAAVLLSVYSALLGTMNPVNASSPVVRPIIHHQRRRNT